MSGCGPGPPAEGPEKTGLERKRYAALPTLNRRIKASIAAVDLFPSLPASSSPRSLEVPVGRMLSKTAFLKRISSFA